MTVNRENFDFSRTYHSGLIVLAVLLGLVLACNTDSSNFSNGITNQKPVTPEDAILNKLKADVYSVKEFREVAVDGETLTVKFEMNRVSSVDSTISMTQESVFDILKSLHDMKLSYNKYKIGGWIPFNDKYGNPKIRHLFDANYSRETLEKINWKGLSFTQILDLADSTDSYEPVEN